MLHTKFRGNRFTGFVENFEGVLPYICMALILILAQVN